VLPPFHARIQYADFTKSYYAGMRGLVRALKEPGGPKPTEIVDATKLVQAIAEEVAKLIGLEQRSAPRSRGLPDRKLVFVVMAFLPDMERIFEDIRLPPLLLRP
jgi:hypothetical protein